MPSFNEDLLEPVDSGFDESKLEPIEEPSPSSSKFVDPFLVQPFSPQDESKLSQAVDIATIRQRYAPQQQEPSLPSEIAKGLHAVDEYVQPSQSTGPFTEMAPPTGRLLPTAAGLQPEPITNTEQDQALGDAVQKTQMAEMLSRVEHPIAHGLGESIVAGAKTMTKPSGALLLGGAAVAPQVFLPIIAAQVAPQIPDTIQEIQRARETGDRAAYYKGIGDLAQEAAVVGGAVKGTFGRGGGGGGVKPTSERFTFEEAKKPVVEEPAAKPAEAPVTFEASVGPVKYYKVNEGAEIKDSKGFTYKSGESITEQNLKAAGFEVPKAEEMPPETPGADLTKHFDYAPDDLTEYQRLKADEKRLDDSGQILTKEGNYTEDWLKTQEGLKTLSNKYNGNPPKQLQPQAATLSDLSQAARDVWDEAKSKDEFAGTDATHLSPEDRRGLASLGLSFISDRNNRILATYPTRMRVEDLRRAVLEKQKQAQAGKEPNASGITSATDENGNLRAPPGTGEGTVPVEEGGPGIRADTTQGTPKEKGATGRKNVFPREVVAGGPERTLGSHGTETVSFPAPEETVAQTPKAIAAIQNKFTPGLEAGRNASQAVRSLLLPSSKSAGHLRDAELLGSKLGAMNQRAEASAYQLRTASKLFDRLGVHNEKLAPDENPGIKFMSDMSQGRPLGKFEAVGNLIEKLFNERLTKLEEAGAELKTIRDNYFPGMWTRESRAAFNAAMEAAVKEGIIGKDFDVNKATSEQKAWVKDRVDAFLENGTGSNNDMLSYFTRKPMKGRESFRKQKVFEDIMQAAEFGLRPISNNPIDLVKGKLAEMDKSIMANQFFQSLKAAGKLKIINPYEETPPGWVKLNDKYGTLYGPPTVKLPEYVDKNVYDGMMKVAAGLGITPQRVFNAGRGKLGYASTSGKTVSQFATELSVLAHELGHQLDFRYGLWDRLVKGAEGTGARGTVTKSASAEQRGIIQKELRALADLSWEGSEPSKYYKAQVRKKAEKMAHLLEAYIHAPERFSEVAPTVFKNFDDFIMSRPELKGLADVKQGLALTKLESEKYVGLPIIGYRIVPEATGDIVNNYLSSSLYNNRYFGGLYKGWMATANALNQTQLGMGSAFHAGFTTGDVQISAGANLLKDVYGVLRGNRSLGDIGQTASTFLTAAGRTAMTGDKVLNAWRNPDGVIDPRIAQVVKATELAGGGYKMESGMTTEQTTKAVRDWFSDHRIRALARTPVALTELMAKPIMEYLVPRQKAGVFSELAWRIIDQNPGVPLEQLTPQFRQAWNRVDARLGQVRYNRLFINNTAKNLVQGLVRAPGWTGGTIAEIGGAFPDTLKFFKEWYDTGKPPQNIPDRVAYTASLLVTVGTANALLTYLFTGTKPQGMDYFAFRTGHKDEQGNDERFLLPTYMKDLVAYARQPLTTLYHKLHPFLSVINDVARNRDYYGYEIRNPHGTAAEQAAQTTKYVIKAFEPFWTRGVRKELERDAGPLRTSASYVGIMPAPAYINRTPIQNKISDLFHLRSGEGTKPYGTQEKDAEKRAARNKSEMDIYMFKRLPTSDQQQLRKNMTREELQRYSLRQPTR